MPRAIGLDLGTRSVTLAELSGGVKKPRWTAFDREPVPFDADGPRHDLALIALAKRHRFSNKTVVVSLPVGAATTREISMPFTEAAKIRDTIRYQAEEYLFSINIEDVLLTWTTLRQFDRKGKPCARVLFSVAQRESIAKLLADCAAAGIVPEAIDLQGAALFNLSRQHPALAATKNALMLDIGATWSTVTSWSEGEATGMRLFRLGAHAHAQRDQEELRAFAERQAASRAAAATTETPPESGEAPAAPAASPTGDAQHPGDDGDAAAPAEPASPELPELDAAKRYLPDEVFLERLEKELRRTLAGMSLAAPVEKIFLLGGGGRLPGIAGYLESRFQTPVERLDLCAAFDAALPDAAREAAGCEAGAALGLAFKGLGADAWKLDFRQAEFKLPPKVQEFLAPAAVLLTLILFLLMMNAVHFLKDTQATNKKRNALEVDATTGFRRIDPRHVPERDLDSGSVVLPMHRLMTAMHREETAPEKDFYPVPSVLDRWMVISRAVLAVNPSDDFSVDYWDFNAEKIELRGTCRDSAEQDKFAHELRKALPELPYGVFTDPGKMVFPEMKKDAKGGDFYTWKLTIDLQEWKYDSADKNSPIYREQDAAETPGKGGRVRRPSGVSALGHDDGQEIRR